VTRLVVETTRCCGRGTWHGNPCGTPECCGEPEVDVAEPTADDLVAWLQARPDLAVEVVAGLRVAGQWREVSDGRWERTALDGYRVATVERGGPDGWRMWYGEHFRECYAFDDAQSVADRWAENDGWALAGDR
jgi:hypothetical protein